MNRIARLLGTADRNQRIVEIGAGYNPVAPKSAGWQTHVVDHTSRAELRAKYSGEGVEVNLTAIDTGDIEEVDTIWAGGSLHEAVPAAMLGQVDRIIASHVLEHMPDLVGFLKSASALVRPFGVLSIALPDRRYCFDCFKPWTTTGDLLEAHHRRLQRHSLKTAFNHMAYSASADHQLGWGAHRIGRPVLMDPFKTAAMIAGLFRDDPNRPYEDYHAHQFTPSSFRLVILELAELGLSDWYVEDLVTSDSFEFFVLLGRGTGARLDAGELQTVRQGLLMAQLLEVRDQVDLILGPPNPQDATVLQIAKVSAIRGIWRKLCGVR